MEKYLVAGLFLFLKLTSFGQVTETKDCKDTIEYYPTGKIWKKYKNCPEVLIDTMYVYNPNGDLGMSFIFGPRGSNKPITKHSYLKSGATREIVSQYILNKDRKPVYVGVTKYYRKNGSLMDSVIYENGKVIYRARFNSKGVLRFENKGN